MARTNETLTNVKVNSIVEGTTLNGEIKAPGNFRIDGTVTGNMAIEGRLIIGAKGSVQGEVVCKDAEIEGFFKGNLRVNGLLALKSSSNIQGDAVFQRLMVEEGATLKCTCNLNTASSSENAKGEKSSSFPDIKRRETESMKAL